MSQILNTLQAAQPKRKRRRKTDGLPRMTDRVPTDADLLKLPLWAADYIRDLRFEIDWIKTKGLGRAGREAVTSGKPG
jgi:hypothetical protein